MKRQILMIGIIGLLASSDSLAGDILIGWFYGSKVESFVFSSIEGEYVVEGDGVVLTPVPKGNMFHLAMMPEGVELRDTTRLWGIFKNIVFKNTKEGSVFQIRTLFPDRVTRESEGCLSVVKRSEGLQLINSLPLEQYIPGTVEAEGGSNAYPEFYKAQAVIARTFAIKNALRHAQEGFNLCDGVHCQAFNGKSRLNKQIYVCTRTTQNEILTNMKGEPLVAAYHANCGGVTGKASVEWQRELPYLEPVSDVFCDKSKQRNWSRKITFGDWQTYLNTKGYSHCSMFALNCADAVRQRYLGYPECALTLAEIRKDLKLKSSYFCIVRENDQILIQGHGYGHGLGMCQEGAMEMARVGYTYVDILMFYYRKAKIIIPSDDIR